MNLADMKTNPKNKRGEAGRQVCDPCAQSQKGPVTSFNKGDEFKQPYDRMVSSYCHLIVHKPENCHWDHCECDCHKSTNIWHMHANPNNPKPLPNSTGTEAGNANTSSLLAGVQQAVDIAQRELDQRRAKSSLFGANSRSQQCWGDHHQPGDCPYLWCSCYCHKGEPHEEMIARCWKVDTEKEIRQTPAPAPPAAPGLAKHRVFISPQDGGDPYPVWMDSKGAITPYTGDLYD